MFPECLGVVPAHNEEQTVGQVVGEVKANLGMSVIVVDDCSTDNTAKEARKAGARVLTLATHCGAWGAMQTGFIWARKKNYRYVVTFDADGQHITESIARVCEELFRGRVDVAIGSYPQRGSRLRRTAWHFFRTASPFSFQDLTSGLRAYNEKALRVLLSPCAYLMDYQDLGILLLLHRAGLRINEVPVEMKSRENGHSRVFSNWSKVAQYMYVTSLLCISKYRQ